jgi:murein tripeptide amidase MpaA
VRIDSDFDGGSIVVLGDTGDGETALALRPDSAADLRQWFCFRSWGEPGQTRRFRIENAGDAEYPAGWEDYRACASYDGEDWFRVPTRYEDGVLGFEHRPARRGVTFACFAPYSHARLRRLVRRADRSRRARVEVLGETVQGRPIHAISFGPGGPSAARVWLIARQHPGETMAAWCAEGIVERLLDEDDPVAAALAEEAVVTVVPCVNVDGGVLGNHRTNAAGRDLNRSWDAPDLEQTPEVFAVRRAILESGVDLFLDVHGDEALPYVFAAACEGNPGYSPRIAALEEAFGESLHMAYPEFSPDQGYERDAAGEADLSCASNWIGERFDCLSLTLEMPFKDDARHPGRRGWSPGRSRALGRAVLESALLTLHDLR